MHSCCAKHRGQDAAGICTVEGRHFHMHKGMGLVRDVLELAICETCSVTAVLDKYVILLRNATVADESRPFTSMHPSVLFWLTTAI